MQIGVMPITRSESIILKARNPRLIPKTITVEDHGTVYQRRVWVLPADANAAGTRAAQFDLFDDPAPMPDAAKEAPSKPDAPPIKVGDFVHNGVWYAAGKVVSVVPIGGTDADDERGFQIQVVLPGGGWGYHNIKPEAKNGFLVPIGFDDKTKDSWAAQRLRIVARKEDVPPAPPRKKIARQKKRAQYDEDTLSDDDDFREGVPVSTQLDKGSIIGLGERKSQKLKINKIEYHEVGIDYPAPSLYINAVSLDGRHVIAGNYTTTPDKDGWYYPIKGSPKSKYSRRIRLATQERP